MPRSGSSSAVVSFDVFSALTDSHSGGSALLKAVCEVHGWPASGTEVYERWDSANKELHRNTEKWIPFRDLSVLAMNETLSGLELPTADARVISDALLDSMVEWPLWPDVTSAGLSAIDARLGLLSNIDDLLLADTAAVRLGLFDPELIVTSQRAQAYKPAKALYTRATTVLGRFVHVASSARDVKGAIGAGIPCIRLVRPGHSLDASGPVPEWSAESLSMVPELVIEAFAKDDHDQPQS